MKIFLISGKAQNGKDTVGDAMYNYLNEKHPNRVLKTHYSDLLKFICTNYFNWDGVKDEKGRKMLQYVGTEKIRSKEPDLWVNFVIFVVQTFQEKWDYVIIPDVRFENEILLWKNVDVENLETVPIVVTRYVKNDTLGCFQRYDNGLTDEQKNHKSETALDGFLFEEYLDNDGSLEAIQRKAVNLTKKYE